MNDMRVTITLAVVIDLIAIVMSVFRLVKMRGSSNE